MNLQSVRHVLEGSSQSTLDMSALDFQVDETPGSFVGSLGAQLSFHDDTGEDSY